MPKIPKGEAGERGRGATAVDPTTPTGSPAPSATSVSPSRQKRRNRHNSTSTTTAPAVPTEALASMAISGNKGGSPAPTPRNRRSAKSIASTTASATAAGALPEFVPDNGDPSLGMSRYENMQQDALQKELDDCIAYHEDHINFVKTFDKNEANLAQLRKLSVTPLVQLQTRLTTAAAGKATTDVQGEVKRALVSERFNTDWKGPGNWTSRLAPRTRR